MKRISPSNITSLQPNEIFVFGSNEGGSHGGGAARTAYKKFGAKWGAAVGLTGQSYAIPTKNARITKTLSLDEIGVYVDQFIYFAQAHPELVFLVTEIGCGLAGLTPESVAPLFTNTVGVENIFLPERFLEVLNREQGVKGSDTTMLNSSNAAK